MKKIKLILLLLFFAIASNSLIAQTAWIRELPIDGTLGSIIQTSDGGYALLANTYDKSIRENIIKYDENGELEWLKTLTLKDDTDFRIHNFIQTSDDGYILIGKSYLQAGGECFVMKTDAFGDTIFTRSIYYEGMNHYNSFHRVVEYAPGDYAILGGKTQSSKDWYIHRFNTEGDLVKIDYEEPFYDVNNYVFKKTEEGRLLIVRNNENPNHCIKDYEYNTIVENNHSIVTDYLHQDNQGGFFRLSRTSFPTFGSYDLPEVYDEYLIKYDNNLDSLWSFNIDTYLQSGVQGLKFGGMTATSDGGYAFCGFVWNIYFEAVFFIKTDEYGNIVHWYGYDGDPWYPFKMATGLFETPDGGFVTFIGSYEGSGDLYLIKTKADGTLNIDDYKKDEFILSVYPNPCSEHVNISFAKKFSGIIKITNINGQNLINTNINNQISKTIDISNFTSGIYFCNIYNQSGNIIYNKKLIKQ